MDTQRLSCPSIAVAIRKVRVLYAITECQECLCGEGTKQRPECNWRRRVQEEKCGVCGVGIFSLTHREF